MGLINWLKTTTFEGKIKKRIGSIKAMKGKGLLEIDLLEAKKDGEKTYRIHIVRNTITSHQSLPIVLSENELKQLGKLILNNE